MRFVLSAVALVILTSGVWAQAPTQAAQTSNPSTGTPMNTAKKDTSGKSGKHHHHKHHHKKQASQPTQ